MFDFPRKTYRIQTNKQTKKQNKRRPHITSCLIFENWEEMKVNELRKQKLEGHKSDSSRLERENIWQNSSFSAESERTIVKFLCQRYPAAGCRGPTAFSFTARFHPLHGFLFGGVV